MMVCLCQLTLDALEVLFTARCTKFNVDGYPSSIFVEDDTLLNGIEQQSESVSLTFQAVAP
jgi:hypothetical protein